MMSSGLTQRRKGQGSNDDVTNNEEEDNAPSTEPRDSQKSFTQLYDDSQEDVRFTLLEEVILLGIKDNEVNSL
jgi:hypothetical protein